jgi:hypothetical protein
VSWDGRDSGQDEVLPRVNRSPRVLLIVFVSVLSLNHFSSKLVVFNLYILWRLSPIYIVIYYDPDESRMKLQIYMLRLGFHCFIDSDSIDTRVSRTWQGSAALELCVHDKQDRLLSLYSLYLELRL